MGKKRSHFGCHLICRAGTEAEKSRVLARRKENKIKFTAFICELSSKYDTQNVEDMSRL